MKTKLILILTFLIVSLLSNLALAGGDRIKLKDGTVYEGSIVAQNDTQYYFNDGKKVIRVNVSDIQEIEFGARANKQSASESIPPSKEKSSRLSTP